MNRALATGLKITKSQQLKAKPNSNELGFGQYFSDHMFLANFSEKTGWSNARIEPYGPLALDPAASVLHYGQELFEGLKAFRQTTGKVVLFRPDFNAHRLQQGAERLCMQAPPAELMLEGLRELVRLEKDWIPTFRGSSLYLRPTLIGTEGFLGVRPSREYLFFIICSPVTSYYAAGTKPVRIWIEENYTRAAPGGLGATKAGANYAASLKAALDAKKKDFAQVLWLDTKKEKIEEVGTMNVFFVMGNKVITPALTGTILNGGVRACSIQILKHLGYTVEEKSVLLKDIIAAHKSGELTEVFGTGTAAVISPVGELANDHVKMQINNRQIGPITQYLYNEITAIQYGEKPDIFNWLEIID